MARPATRAECECVHPFSSLPSFRGEERSWEGNEIRQFVYGKVGGRIYA